VVSVGQLDEFSGDIRGLKTFDSQRWMIPAVNVRSGNTTDIAALYVESLNDTSNVLATRISVAPHSRSPPEM